MEQILLLVCFKGLMAISMERQSMEVMVVLEQYSESRHPEYLQRFTIFPPKTVIM